MGASGDERESPLQRAISPRLLFFFILGDILGGGIYALVGEVGGEVGGAIWTAFLAAFVLALLTAFSYVELVTKYPRAAGAALYTHKAFKRPFLTFMVAFGVMASGITSAATLARAFAGDYFQVFLDLPLELVALLFIAGVALLNLRGIAESIKVNATFTVIEVVGLLLIVIVGIAAVAKGTAEPGRAFEFEDGIVPLLILNGATLAFYALIGFEDSVNVAEETKDPSIAFPRALFGGLAVAGVIYLVVTILASMVVETDRLAGSSGPLLEVISVGPLGIPERLFSAIALFALANGALINMIMASRLVYGMSSQGIVPKGLGSVLPGRKTPWAAILFTTALAAMLIVTGDLGTLADTTVLLLLGAFALVNVSVLVLRRDRVDHDHFRAPPVLPVLGALVSVVLITQNDAEVFARAGLLLLLGAAFWGLNRLAGGPRGDLEAEALSG